MTMIKRKRTVVDTVVDIVTVLMVVGIVVAIGYAYNYTEHHYTRTGTVINTQAQRVYVEDTSGDVWCYEVEGDAPSVGSTVDLCMYTSNTDNYIYDDEVIKVVVY